MSPLRSRIVGQGADLALVHGWGLGSAAWAPVVDALAQHCRVHLVDLPGYGEAGTDAGADFGNLARRLIASLPPGVTLCGWSLGGMLALQAALLAPEHIARLVLVAATPSFTQRADWSAGQPPALLDAFQLALGDHPKAALQRFVALLNQGDAQARAIGRTLIAGLSASQLPDSEALAQGLGFLREIDLRLDLRPQIASAHTPTLLIHGDCDPLMPLAAAQWLAEHLPNSRLEVFAGAAHAPFLNDPERFAARVLNFCDAATR
ncbi:MAG: alpha/beta fold hydrolase [Betaproteobacteria bacterium]|nr:alpha/beta fold hydrolase [Betaproteobacteria bacterium]